MKTLPSPFRPFRRNAAFSLVEVALALGIVGFALVGIVGALPVAMNNGRLSIAQSRAASLANTVFANFRAQPFTAVQYLDDTSGGTPINLDVMTWQPKNAGENGTPVTFYAAFDEVASLASVTDERRLHFVNTPPTSGTYYKIVLSFDNNPNGTLAPYPLTSGAASYHAQANAIEASIFEADRPKDVFHFNSVIANRSE